MAEGLNDTPRIVRASDEHVADSLPAGVRVGGDRSAQRSASPHSRKFLAVAATLIGIAVGALVIAVLVLLHGGTKSSSGTWSQWAPSDQGLAGEREIAAELSPFYRASPASQLVVVTVQNVADSSANTGPTGAANSTGTLQLAVRDPNSKTLSAITGNSAVYNLCGLGPGCAIATGTPSSARLLLLRREALELSLYTLKYINGIQNVVALLPPGRTTATGQLTSKPPAPGNTSTTSSVDLAVVFQKAALQRYLDRPLNQTLPEQLPPTVDEMPNAPEAELVSVLTGEALFQQQLIQDQAGGNVLVLSPVPPQ